MKMDYVTKWEKAKATINNDIYTIAKSVYKYIFMRDRLSIKTMNDRGKHFLNNTIKDEFMVIHNNLEPYHP